MFASCLAFGTLVSVRHTRFELREQEEEEEEEEEEHPGTEKRDENKLVIQKIWLSRKCCLSRCILLSPSKAYRQNVHDLTVCFSINHR